MENVAAALRREAWDALPTYRQAGSHSSGEGHIPFLPFTAAFILITFVFELYLDWRQLRSYETTVEVPDELKGIVDSKVYHKSRLYGKEKLAFGILKSTFSLFEALLLLIIGFQPYAWDVSAKISEAYLIPATASPLFREMIVSSIFFFLLTLQSQIVSLPFSYYSSFVVEEKHGFNKMDVKTFVKDQVLSLALCFGIGSPVLAGVVWVIRKGGPHFYFYVWAFLFVISLLFMTLYPVLIAPLFNKYTKLENSDLYDAIKALAQRVQFPLTNIFTVDGSKRSAHSNAYFYGFFKNKRIVLFDTLIEQVTRSELLAILGHEIGHWKLGHTVQNFVITQGVVFAIFCFFSFVQTNVDLFESFGFNYPDEADIANQLPPGSSPMPVLIGLMVFAQSMWAPIDKVLTLIMTVNSRRNEFAADNFAKELGMSSDLQSGLIKIHTENLGNLAPDPLYSAYHFSHPSLVERLRALRSSGGSGSSSNNNKSKAKKQN